MYLITNQGATPNFRLLLAKREHPEKWYQEGWCREQGGQIEVVLPDKTRCDCVTDTHAIEFDFGSGWAEAIYMRIRYDLTIQLMN